MIESLASKTMWNAVASVFVASSRFVVLVFVTRFLAKAQMGQFSYLLWLVEFIRLSIDMGMQGIAYRYFATFQGEQNQEAIVQLKGWIARFYLKITGVGLLLFWGACGWKGWLFHDPWLAVLFSLFFVFQTLAYVYRSILRGEQRFRDLSKLEFVSAVLFVSGGVAGSYFFGLLGAVGGFLVAAAAPALLSFRFLARYARAPRPSEELKKQFRTFGFFIWINSVMALVVWSRTELFFIELWHPVEMVADFAVATSVVGLVYQSTNLFLGGLIQHFSQVYGAHGEEGIRERYPRTTKVLYLFLIPAGFGAASLMPVLVTWLFGARYASAVLVAMVLACSSIFSMNSVASAGLLATDDSRSVFIAATSGALCFVLLSLLVVPHGGALGAAFVKVLSQATVSAFLYGFFWKRFSVPPRVGVVCKIFANALIAALLSLLIVVHLGHWIAIPLAIPAAVVSFTLGIKLLSLLEEDDRQGLESILSRLPTALQTRALGFLSWLMPHQEHRSN